MAAFTITPGVTMAVEMVLNESEARALEALASYGDDAFLKTFYEKMGRFYLEPDEAGLRSLFAKVRTTLPPALTAVANARKDLHRAGFKTVH